MLGYSRGSETRGHVPGDLRQRATLLACSWTGRLGGAPQGARAGVLTWLSMPNMSNMEKKRVAQRGETGSWATASGYARNARPGPVRGAEGETQGPERPWPPQHARLLSFIPSHVQSRLFSECRQPPFPDKGAVWEGAGREAGGATGLGPEARGPVR